MSEVSAIGTNREWWLEFWDIPQDQADAAWKAKLRLDERGSFDSAPGVIADIQPYKSQQTGEMITSRSKHRNHLKEHGLIEVGTEKPKAKEYVRTKKEQQELRRDIAAQLDQVRK